MRFGVDYSTQFGIFVIACLMGLLYFGKLYQSLFPEF